MAKSRKSIKNQRTAAFIQQSGRCYQCNQPIWTENPINFAAKHNITLGQARRCLCTGEHLVAHKDGGSVSSKNIVAASWFCNQKQHKRKEPPSPDQYEKIVDQRMSQGRWHEVRLN